jgi:hypothetical protein
MLNDQIRYQKKGGIPTDPSAFRARFSLTARLLEHFHVRRSLGFRNAQTAPSIWMKTGSAKAAAPGPAVGMVVSKQSVCLSVGASYARQKFLNRVGLNSV